jgi:hypothetical protein
MFVKHGRNMSDGIAVCNKFKDNIKIALRELKDIYIYI